MRRVLIVVAMMSISASICAAQDVTIDELRSTYPPNVDALDPGFHWAPEFSRDTVTPERARVPIQTDWPDIDGLTYSPVTFGVPFADGALQSAENARLITVDGTPVPADLRTTATWWRKDGPVRWMLVSATLERGEDYFIEYGTEVEAYEEAGMRVDETDDAIVIDTGSLQATISKTRPTILDAATVNGEAIVTPEAASADLPTVIGGDGTAYPASSDGLKVSFTRQGPNETVIRREGWYTSDAGERYCQFITYTWFFAGSASVRHDHTLVVGFDTQQNTIRDIRLALPVGSEVSSARIWPSGAPRPGFDFSMTDEFVEATGYIDSAGGTPPSGESIAAGDLPARVVQTGRSSVVTTAGTTREDRAWAQGRIVGLRSPEIGVGMAVRDFAEQFPMELEVTREAVVAHLWPAHDAPVLDFRPSVVMGDEYPEDRIFHRSFYEGGLDAWTQAYGLGKTHNLQFSFLSDGDAGPEAFAQLQAFEEPVLAYADPEYACDTWAFGRVRHDDPEGLPKIEALMDAIIHRKHYLRNRLGHLGWINFGDVNYDLDSESSLQDISDRAWRNYSSMFYGGPNVFPLAFMRSGDRDAWDFARTNARHVTDIDICHLDDNGELDFRYEKRKGGRYGGNGGICHYAANIYSIGCDCHTRFMLWDYYLNGTPRTWEVFEEFVSQYARRRNLGHNLVYRTRHTGGPLRLFSEAYEATWDPEYLSCAHQFADILYDTMEELGKTRYDDVYMNEGKVKYYQLTGDQRMRELFLNDVRIFSELRDAHVFEDTRSTTLWGLAHAYWLTGDESFLPFAMWQYQIATTRVPTAGPPEQIGAVSWTFEHAYESTLGNQLPSFAALLADLEDAPAPLGPPTSGIASGPIYLQETEDRAFTITADVGAYERGVPGCGAAGFANWRDWALTLPEDEQPALVLTDPEGAVITRFVLVGERQQDGARYTGAEDAPGQVRFTVEADGKTGTYALAPQSSVVPMRIEVSEHTLDGLVLDASDSWVYRETGTTQYFLVPAGTEQFTMQVKSIALRQDVRVSVRDPQGEEVTGTQWMVSSNPRHSWQSFKLDAGSPPEDEIWSVIFPNPVSSFIRLEGVPKFVAFTPDELFLPDRTLEAATVPAPEGDAPSYAESPMAAGGQALALPPKVAYALTSPDGAPLLNEAEGTIEMWIRDTRQPTDLHDRGFIECGDFKFYRRINLGTYLYLDRLAFQSGIILPPGRWVHLAATWYPSQEKPGVTDGALFVDGVRLKDILVRRNEEPEGWAGTELVIPAEFAGVYMDELRISDVARYDGSFDRPEAPFAPDDNTLVLSHFDDGSALVRGEEVEWQVR